MKLKSLSVSLACLFVVAGAPDAGAEEVLKKNATGSCGRGVSLDLPKLGPLLFGSESYQSGWRPMPANFFDYFNGGRPVRAEERPVHFVPEVGDKFFISPCWSGYSMWQGSSAAVIYEITNVEYDANRSHCRISYTGRIYGHGTEWQYWPMCDDYGAIGWNFPDATATPRLRTGGTEVSMPSTSNDLPQADSSNGGCSSCSAPALPFDRKPGNLSLAIGLGIDSKVAAQIAYEPNLAEVHKLSLSDLKIQNVLGGYQGDLLSGSVTVLDQLGLIQSTITVQTTPPIDPNAGYPGQNFQSIVLTVTPVGEAGRPVTTHTFERVSATGADFTGQGVRYTRTEGSQTQTMAFYNSGDGACGRATDGTLWGSFKTVDANGNVELWTAAPEDSAISWDETQGRWVGELLELHEFIPAAAGNPKISTERRYARIGNQDPWNSRRVLTAETVTTTQGTSAPIVQTTRHGYDGNPVLADGMPNPYFGMKRWQVNADNTWELNVRGHVPDAASPDLVETVQVTPWMDSPGANLGTAASAEAFFTTLTGRVSGDTTSLRNYRVIRINDNSQSYALMPWTRREITLINGVVHGTSFELNGWQCGNTFTLSAGQTLYPVRRTERWNGAGTKVSWSQTFEDGNGTTATLDESGTASLTYEGPATGGMSITDRCRVTFTEIPNAAGPLPSYQKGTMHPLWSSTTTDRSGRVHSEVSRFGNEGAPIQTINTTYTGETAWTRTTSDGVVLSSQGEDVVANGQRTSTSTDADGVTTTTVTDEATGEMISETRLGLTTNHTQRTQPDGSAVRQTKRTVGGTTRMLSSLVTDTQGRTVSSMGADGKVTYYSYSADGRTVTERFSGFINSNRATTTYLDGQVKSITGTVVPMQRFNYRVATANNETGCTEETVTTEGGGVAETITNSLGQVVQERHSSPAGSFQTIRHNYNAKGQRVSTRRGGMAPLLFEYDEWGQVSRQGYDMNGDGALTVGSKDVLTESSTDYVLAEGTVLERTVRKQYTKDGDAEALQTTTERRLLEGSQWQRVTQADGGVLTQWDERINGARLVHAQQVNGARTLRHTQTYEGGRLVRETQPGMTQAITYEYTGFDELWKIVHPQSGTTTRTYDTKGRLLTERQAGGGTVTYSYDSFAGPPYSIRQANGSETTYIYDQSGRVLRESGTEGYMLEYTYDSLGRLTRLNTRRGANIDTTVWAYSGPGSQPVQKRDAAGQTTTYRYDLEGRLTARVSARGVTRSQSYDAAGRLTRISYSDGTPAVTHAYDRAGRMVSTTDAAGTHTFTYDAASGGQLDTWTVSGSGVWSGLSLDYGYTAGQRSSRTASLGSSIALPTVGYTYEPASGRMESVSADGVTATYRYNAATGWNDGVTYSSGLSSTRAMDALGRLDAITWSAGGNVVSGHDYTLDAMNRRTAAQREDGSQWNYGYNSRGEVTSAAKADAIGPGKRFYYAYDGIGNRTSSSVSSLRPGINPPNVTTYTTSAGNKNLVINHPQPGWLVLRGSVGTAAGTTVKIDGNAPSLTTGTLWFHEQSVDNSGGPVRREVEISATRPDGGVNNGPVTSKQKGALFIPPPTELPTYDLDGNQTSDARWTYTWDGENRLIAAEEKTGFTVLPTSSAPVKRTRLEFSYDAQGRRIGKQTFIATGSGGFVLQQSLVHLYDGWNMIAEIDTTSSAQLLRSYEWGLDVSGTMAGAGGVGGLLMERFRTGPASVTYAPCYDGNGNVTELVNLANGSVSARYEYGAFGETISVDGGAVASVNPFRFSTKYLDAETGLYNYGYRYYDAVNGRWLNRDPIEEEGGINLYGMCENDTINFWDNLGMSVGVPLPGPGVNYGPQGPQRPPEMPGTGESMIPIWGAAREADYYYYNGQYGWGAFYTAMAVSDVVLIKSVATGIGRGCWKVGSHSWKATRAWYGKTRPLDAMQEVHHWLLNRRQGIGRFMPDWLKNQPWNLLPIPQITRNIAGQLQNFSSKTVHHGVHGKSKVLSLKWTEKLWLGTPHWAKNFSINIFMHSTSLFRKIGESNDNTATIIDADGSRMKIEVGSGRILEGANNSLLNAGTEVLP